MRIWIAGVLLLAPLTVVSGAEAGAAGAAECEGVEATIVGTERAEVIDGTDGRDVIVALGGADRIRGHDGRDLICGGHGADRMSGGTGNDVLHGGSGADHMWGGAGSDRLVPDKGDDSLHGGTDDDVVWNFDGADDASTGAGDDTIIFDDRGRADHEPVGVDAGPGRDRVDVSWPAGWSVAGGTGDDIVNVGSYAGGDFVLASGPMVMRSGPGADDVSFSALSPGTHEITLEGGVGRDALWFDGGAATAPELVVDQASDILEWGGANGGFSGWEELWSISQMSLSYAGSANSEIIVWMSGRVTAHMRGGDDHVESAGGSVENDVLFGGPGADSLIAFGGDDFLGGGTGIERWLDGGEGIDTASDPDDDPETAVCMGIEIGFCASPQP